MAASLESLMECRPGTPEFDTYAVYDPKAPAGRSGSAAAPAETAARGPFRDAIVFVIGGGNYLEREVLGSWAARCQPARHLLYGATELLSGDEFMQQLGEVGKRAGA